MVQPLESGVMNHQPEEDIINKAESVPLKKGVEFVFEQNPELASIGSVEQYSEYLDTVFPDSKIKNIVYHQAPKSAKEFEGHDWNISYLGGAYFSFHNTKSGGPLGSIIQMIAPERTIVSVVDIENPYKITKKENSDKEIQSISRLRKKVDLSSYDSVIGYANIRYDKGELDDLDTINEKELTNTNNIEIVVLNPKQVHVLGSKTDKEKFRQFVTLNSLAYLCYHMLNFNLVTSN